MFDGHYVMWGGEHSLFTRKLEAMLNYVDFEWGGFKGSPKFPQFYVFESFIIIML